MAIVFVSPKQRQKMFFLGITILFLLLISVVGTVVFFSKPAPTSTETIFKKPNIKIDFTVLDSEQIKESSLMSRIQKEFTYSGITAKGSQESGNIFATTMEEATKTLETKKLTNVSLEEVLVGRENPFSSYYTSTDYVNTGNTVYSPTVSLSNPITQPTTTPTTPPITQPIIQPITQPIAPPITQPITLAYDVILKNDETGNKNYGPVASDLERGDLIRQAVKEMKVSDTLILGEGRFDLDCKTRGTLLFPDQITVIGKGMDKTRLFSNCWSDSQGSAYEIRNGNYFDLTFENQSWDVNEDGRTVEMYPGFKRTPDNLNYVWENGSKVKEQINPGPFSATFDRVKFIGNAWVVYDWSDRGHNWTIRDSVIIGGRQAVSMMAGGTNYQNAYILRTKFDIDTMRSEDIGATSNNVYGGGYGIVARGGDIRVEDSEFYIKCEGTPHPASFIPRCVGVYDGNDFSSNSSSHTLINLINNRWFISGSGSKDVYDIFMTNAEVKSNLQVSGGCGSGPGCLITKNW